MVRLVGHSPMTVQLMTVSAYARQRGCDEKAVRKAIEEGRISSIVVDGRKRIDPAVADIQWAQNTRARADSKRSGVLEGADGGGSATDAAASAPAAPAATEPGYADFRTRRERAEAEMAERANQREAGLALDRRSTERGVFDVMRAYRDAMQAIGPRAAPKCIGLGDARQIEHVISEEVRRALSGFEERLQGLLPPLEGTGS